MKVILIILLTIITLPIQAEPLKLFTDFEYKELLKGDVTFTDSIQGQSFIAEADGNTLEAVIGLKQKLTPWLQISGGLGYDREKQQVSGQVTEYDLTYVFIKVQTVIVLTD